jgi:hypothetical protein
VCESSRLPVVYTPPPPKTLEKYPDFEAYLIDWGVTLYASYGDYSSFNIFVHTDFPTDCSYHFFAGRWAKFGSRYRGRDYEAKDRATVASYAYYQRYAAHVTVFGNLHVDDFFSSPDVVSHPYVSCYPASLHRTDYYFSSTSCLIEFTPDVIQTLTALCFFWSNVRNEIGFTGALLPLRDYMVFNHEFVKAYQSRMFKMMADEKLLRPPELTRSFLVRKGKLFSGVSEELAPIMFKYGYKSDKYELQPHESTIVRDISHYELSKQLPSSLIKLMIVKRFLRVGDSKSRFYQFTDLLYEHVFGLSSFAEPTEVEVDPTVAYSGFIETEFVGELLCTGEVFSCPCRECARFSSCVTAWLRSEQRSFGEIELPFSDLPRPPDLMARVIVDYYNYGISGFLIS